MNFEFDFFGIDRLYSIPIQANEAASTELPDWILVSLQGTQKSWLLLNLERSDWKDDSAALELANVIAARKLAECDGLTLSTPQWMSDLQKRQLPEWLKLSVESGRGHWAGSRFPSFSWHLVNEIQSNGSH